MSSVLTYSSPDGDSRLDEDSRVPQLEGGLRSTGKTLVDRGPGLFTGRQLLRLTLQSVSEGTVETGMGCGRGSTRPV